MQNKKQCFLRERESFMEYFIVFDAGAVGIFLLILLLGGTAAVGAAGVWLYEHFWVLALAVFILSLIKSLSI